MSKKRPTPDERFETRKIRSNANYATTRRKYSADELRDAAIWKDQIVNSNIAWVLTNESLYFSDENLETQVVQPAIVMKATSCNSESAPCSVDVFELDCRQCFEDYDSDPAPFEAYFWGDVFGSDDLATKSVKALLQHLLKGYLRLSQEWDQNTKSQRNEDSFVYQIETLGLPEEDRKAIAQQVRDTIGEKFAFRDLPKKTQIMIEMLEHPETYAYIRRYTYDPRFDCGVAVECDRAYVGDREKWEGVFERCALRQLLLSGAQMARLESTPVDQWEAMLNRSFRAGRKLIS